MHVVFLPGGGGAADFWHPLGALLPADWEKSYLYWPGLGNQPHDARINGFDDLVRLVEEKITDPVALVAQSMGCVVAFRAALKHPANITHLVLAAVSGGIDLDRFGGEDWRPAYLQAYPNGAPWIAAEKPDHTQEIARIACPASLLWGDADPISPVAAGSFLASLLPRGELHVVAGGTHSLAKDRAAEIAPIVHRFLGSSAT